VLIAGFASTSVQCRPQFSPQKSNGARAPPTKVSGISSQLLRYIEILMLSPWNVELGKENEYPFSPKRKVQIANPASVLAQKILMHGEREPRDRAKDLPYIHDTIEVFSEGPEELQKIFGQEVLRSSIHEEEPASKVRPTDCSARWTMRFVKQLSWPSGEGSLHNSLPRLLKRA
jgi:hypothetical protein